MQISSRFTIAIHIFACIETFKEDYKITSDFLSSSINVNPVIIRKLLSQLKNAGLIVPERKGNQILYAINMTVLQEMAVEFLSLVQKKEESCHENG